MGDSQRPIYGPKGELLSGDPTLVGPGDPLSTVVGEDGMPTYTASGGSEWDMFVGGGEDVEEILALLEGEREDPDA